MVMARKKTKIAIAIDPAVLRDLDRVVKAEGRSRSSWIERVIREALNQELELVKALSNPLVADAMAKAFGNEKVLKAMYLSMGEKASAADVKKVGKAIDGVVGAMKPDRGE